MAKIIVCVDMDAFFASVEQRDNPALRGKPIAITGAGERTVIITSSYEARAYSVKMHTVNIIVYRTINLSLLSYIGQRRKPFRRFLSQWKKTQPLFLMHRQNLA